MMLIDKMLLTNDCKLSCISSETLKYDMRKSMCRATPGDSTVYEKLSYNSCLLLRLLFSVFCFFLLLFFFCQQRVILANCGLDTNKGRIQDFWRGGSNEEKGVRFPYFTQKLLKFLMKMKQFGSRGGFKLNPLIPSKCATANNFV